MKLDSGSGVHQPTSEPIPSLQRPTPTQESTFSIPSIVVTVETIDAVPGNPKLRVVRASADLDGEPFTNSTVCSRSNVEIFTGSVIAELAADLAAAIIVKRQAKTIDFPGHD